ncbi:transmembrane protein 43 isoform X1 [Lycorma delicatula]|uniref:transmembrane protein 43 isoform X1 n=1 Tax=Lycorma delicatula TaxID=130591 RepID=UPI003F51393D
MKKKNGANVLVGLVLLSAGIWLLYWNERRAVNITHSLNEALNSVIHVSLIEVASEMNEGMLVYICGPLRIDEPLTEPEYGISVPAVKLKQRVQMYQWTEEENINNDIYTKSWDNNGKSYTYTTEWRDKLIDSNRFYTREGHHNPKEFPMKSEIYISEGVHIGKYTLSSELKEKLNDFIAVTSDERPERRDIKLHAGLYYHSIDVWNPEVGDIRVQFSYAGAAGDIVSIVGRQVGTELHGNLLARGRVPVDVMLSQQHAHNTWLIRLFRLLAWLLIYLAVTFLHHLIILDDTWLSVTLVFAVTAIAWFAYQPWLGCLFFGGSLISFTWPFFKTLHHDRHYHSL